jgi:GT2 family glycosyltransferase
MLQRAGEVVAPTAAILIVTHNSRQYLDALFDSLRLHTDPAKTAIIVVDNASKDDTVGKLGELAEGFSNVEIHAQAGNTGFAGGNNIALQRAREMGAQYALLLNPDTVVTAGWFEELTAVMEARPEVAAAQPLLMLWDEPELINSAGNAVHFCGFTYCGGYRQRKEDIGLNGEVRSVPYASGAALLLRVEALDEVGDFDEDLFLYLEELDLQLRLRQRGYECVLVPTARVMHKYRAEFSPSKYGWLERNRWMVLLKNWPWRPLVAAAPVLLGLELAVLATAARGGWMREKMWSYREIARYLPRTLANRREIQRRRAPSANDMSLLTGALDHEGFGNAKVARVAGKFLSAYWGLARRVLAIADA